MAAIRSDRRWWTTLGIGVVACVGCCAALPLLAAVGLAGSGALMIGVGWLEPIGVGLIAVGLIGVVVSRVRAGRRAGSCRADHGKGKSCTCAPPKPEPRVDPTSSTVH